MSKPTRPALKCLMKRTPQMIRVASAAATADSERQRQGADQHRPFHEVLGVVGDVEHRQTVENDSDEDRAGDGPDYVGAALIENGKPDQGSGDAVQKERRARKHIASPDPSRNEDSAQRSERARDDISGDPIALDRRSGEVSCGLVAA